ncbi:MAG: RimK family alpha-L-glutamate ligase [Gammaproteobacteria bacterium]|nr:MAG: RimK family alpha-L-glutamate ligase [Gammaproteobacteria bacterium]
MSQANIVIFNDTHGWHSEQLVDALSKLNITAQLTDLADCTIDLDHPTGLIIPGFEQQLPDAAMVRGIAPGTLEQITLRMDVLHTLAELNVPVFNSASAIEHTVDKARTSLRLHLAGIPTPKTWACENINLARNIAQRQFSQQKELVVKPLFGCQGKGIEKINSLDQLDQLNVVGDAFYMQEYIIPFEPEHWQDWRLMVIDGHVCAAMSRRSQHWITNFAQGAECFSTPVTDEMEQLAIAATDAVQADYAGVDLIRTQDGSYTVLEVNSVPAWKGLYQATGINTADYLAKALATRIASSKRRQCHVK